MKKIVAGGCLALSVIGMAFILLQFSAEFEVGDPLEPRGWDEFTCGNVFGNSEGNAEERHREGSGEDQASDARAAEAQLVADACQDGRDERIARAVVLTPIVAVLGSVGVIGLSLRRP